MSEPGRTMDCLRPAFCGGIPCRALGAVARTLSLPVMMPTAFQPSARILGSRSLEAGSWFTSHISHAYMTSKAYFAQSSLLKVRTSIPIFFDTGIGGSSSQNGVKIPVLPSDRGSECDPRRRGCRRQEPQHVP